MMVVGRIDLVLGTASSVQLIALEIDRFAGFVGEYTASKSDNEWSSEDAVTVIELGQAMERLSAQLCAACRTIRATAEEQLEELANG